MAKSALHPKAPKEYPKAKVNSIAKATVQGKVPRNKPAISVTKKGK